MARLHGWLFVPVLPGCVAFGYPSLTYTPEVANLPPDVRAFKSTFERVIFMTGGGTIHFNDEEVPIREGRLVGQDEAYFAYCVGGVVPVGMHERRWSIRLYRPGYEVIDIQSRLVRRKLLNAPVGDLDWKTAPDLDSQVKALERVCPWPCLHFANPEVRQFFVEEYERLASSAIPSTADQREALFGQSPSAESACPLNCRIRVRGRPDSRSVRSFCTPFGSILYFR